MRLSVSCGRRAEDVSELSEVACEWVGSNTHPWLSWGPQPARFTETTAFHAGVGGGWRLSISPSGLLTQALAAHAASLICNRNISRTCQHSL